MWEHEPVAKGSVLDSMVKLVWKIGGVVKIEKGTLNVLFFHRDAEPQRIMVTSKPEPRKDVPDHAWLWIKSIIPKLSMTVRRQMLEHMQEHDQSILNAKLREATGAEEQERAEAAERMRERERHRAELLLKKKEEQAKRSEEAAAEHLRKELERKKLEAEQDAIDFAHGITPFSVSWAIDGRHRLHLRSLDAEQVIVLSQMARDEVRRRADGGAKEEEALK